MIMMLCPMIVALCMMKMLILMSQEQTATSNKIGMSSRLILAETQ